MEYRTLGRTGVQVSQLCFGAMSFGHQADEAMSAAMFHRCREAGINFYDCADIYGGGRSETILGALIAGCRDQIVLTSKVHGPTGQDINDRGLSRRHIMLAIEDSLRRLGTDRLDLYFLHQWDPLTPLEQTLRALEDLVKQGKVLYPAISNFAAWQTARALGMADLHGWIRVQCLQPMYNLAKRQAEVEILPLAAAEQLGVISYSPLGGGLLTGKYGVDRRPQAGRLLENPNYIKRYGEAVYYEVAERFKEYANRRGNHPATLAVAWVMSHPAVTAPIIGARDLEQLEPSLAAAEVKLTPHERSEISALSIEPPLATDRTDDKGRES